jgi:hypothetical protein
MLERVVRDVITKSKPGDDLIGNIRAAVGFVLFGAGVEPENVGRVTAVVSRF